MFSVAAIYELPKKSLFVRRRFSVESIPTAVRSGAPFITLDITPSPKGIDWQRVAAEAGRSGKNIIVPNGICFSSATGLERFVPSVLPLKIMLNTAAKRLGEDADALARTLLVSDKYAVLAPFIDSIVNCAAIIKIVTDNPKAYFWAAQRVMERFGASLKICDSVGASETFDAAVSLESLTCATQCFSADKIGCDGWQLVVPDEYLRLCPPGIDVFDFACALYECSGVRAIGDLTLK